MLISPSTVPTQAYRTAWIASMWACLLLCGCDEKREPQRSDHASRAVPVASSAGLPVGAPEPKRGRAAAPEASSRPAGAKDASSAGAPTASRAPAASASAAGALDTGLLSAEIELGASAPVALAPGVMVAKTKKDDLVLTPLRKDSHEPLATSEEELSAWPVGLASGSSTHAYWVSSGRLVRREVKQDLSQGPLEVLATGAANAAVAASRSTGATERDVVLYIGSEVSREGERAARLWVEGHGSRPLSREAGGATSVSVIHLGAGRFALVTLDGRVGMSPVHALSLELDAQGAPHVGEDRVVHVAGPAQRGTALAGVQLGRGPLVLLPISKDARSFGLLMLRVGYGDKDTPSAWVDYPNGLDPAPVAAATLCGNPAVAFVRPQGASPGSARVLELGRMSRSTDFDDRTVVATSSRISHVDLWGDAAGGWVVYTTDRGLRGRRVACK